MIQKILVKYSERKITFLKIDIGSNVYNSAEEVKCIKKVIIHFPATLHVKTRSTLFHNITLFHKCSCLILTSGFLKDRRTD
jgi:hypothetical protein